MAETDRADLKTQPNYILATNKKFTSNIMI